MVRVTIELDKKGKGTDIKLLGTLLIANDGTGDLKTGNYRCRLLGANGQQMGEVVSLKGWQRTRWHAADLVLACLARLRGEKHPKIVKGDFVSC